MKQHNCPYNNTNDYESGQGPRCEICITHHELRQEIFEAIMYAVRRDKTFFTHPELFYPGVWSCSPPLYRPHIYQQTTTISSDLIQSISSDS